MHHHLTITKNINWQKNLIQTFNDHKNVPFEWGKTDCIIFSLKCLDAQVNEEMFADIVARITNKYDTYKTAKKFLQTEFGGTMFDAINPNFKQVEFTHRQRGDVCLFDASYDDTTGIVWTNGIMAMGEKGSTIIPFNKVSIKNIWRV